MKIKQRNISTENITHFSTYNDPFNSNTYTLVLEFDNGQQEKFTYFKLDEMQQVVNELFDEIRTVRRYKRIVGGVPRMNIKERTKVRSER
jgi:hypothetical protein